MWQLKVTAAASTWVKSFKMQLPYVSVVLPALNIASLLEMNLHSLVNQDYPGSRLEVIVVDDGSTDHTLAMCRSMETPCTLKILSAGSNSGRARARNLGLQSAEGDIVIFCDGDTLQPPEFIKNHVSWHQKNDNLVLGSRPLYEQVCYTHLFKGFDKRQQRELSSVFPEWKHHLQGDKAVRILEPDELRADFGAARRLAVARPQIACQKLIEEMGEFSTLPIDWMAFVTRNVSLRRSLLLEAGGFDENFQGWGGEDWDLGFRLKKMGASFECREDLVNYHQEHPVENRKTAESRRNGLYMLAKHRAPELCFVPGENGPWTLYHYGRFVKQYQDIKESGSEQGLVESFASLMMAIVSRNTGLNIDDELHLDMLNAARSKRRLMNSHHEFVFTFDTLVHRYLNKTDAKDWQMKFQEADLQEMGLQAACLGELVQDILSSQSHNLNSIINIDDIVLMDLLKNTASQEPAISKTEGPNFHWTSCLQSCPVPIHQSASTRPGAEILAPFIAQAVSRADILSDGIYQRNTSNEVRNDLEQTLWQSLWHIGAPTIELHLALYQRDQTDIGNTNGNKEEIKRQASFMEHYLYGGLQELLFDYPVLARLLITIGEHWTKTVDSVPSGSAPAITLSNNYRRLFTAALEPKFMRSGCKRSLELLRYEAGSTNLANDPISILELEKQVLNLEGPRLFDLSY
ncbi:MAG: glycosyltransferase [Syntrophomonas sp.]